MMPARISRDSAVKIPFRLGLTKVEFLIVIVVLLLVVSLASPWIMSAREQSRRYACQNNLRQLGNGMRLYHETYRQFPAAAVWSTSQLQSLALHKSRRIDLYTQTNWAQALLPFISETQLASQLNPNLLIAAPENEAIRKTRIPLMTCVSDTYNTPENPYLFQPNSRETISFARGNYAINGGTHCFNEGTGSTAYLTGDNAHLEMSHSPRSFKFWGNGVAGFNVSFSYDDFENGTSSLVALEEVRAGIDAIDPRGVWSLGQIGGSVTWAHGVNGDAYGPNNQHPKSDDLLYGTLLNEKVGAAFLKETRMPCVSYVDLNYQATSRSLHPGGVNVLTADGATRFVSDKIDPGLWHILHSRETPGKLLEGNIDSIIQQSFDIAQKADLQRKTVHSNSGSAVENSIGMHFLLIPAGEFEMGLADQGNSHELPEESPQHHVVISNPYYLGKHEVTQTDYLKVMGTMPSGVSPESLNPPESDKMPVTQVTWDEADEFCRRLSTLPTEKSAGRSYRLPTEAEWEYACRAGSQVPYHWSKDRRSDDTSGDAASILPPLALTPVGSFPANAFGLCDMRGNAWEWCADWFERDYYLTSPENDPQGPLNGYVKVVRGSSWTFIGEMCKLSYPMMLPWKSSPYVGFRVVCEVDAPASDAK